MSEVEDVGVPEMTLYIGRKGCPALVLPGSYGLSVGWQSWQFEAPRPEERPESFKCDAYIRKEKPCSRFAATCSFRVLSIYLHPETRNLRAPRKRRRGVILAPDGRTSRLLGLVA